MMNCDEELHFKCNCGCRLLETSECSMALYFAHVHVLLPDRRGTTQYLIKFNVNFRDLILFRLINIIVELLAINIYSSSTPALSNR